MIIILRSTIDNDLTGQPASRGAYFYIESSGEAYMHMVGNLPLTGGLQAILEANEAQHFTDAQTNGILPTPKEKAIAEAIVWFQGNPATKQIFTLTPAELETQVGALVDALYPGIAASTRNQEKKVRMAQLMAIRVSVRGELEDLGQ
jgi:hypothetical protein